MYKYTFIQKEVSGCRYAFPFKIYFRKSNLSLYKLYLTIYWVKQILFSSLYFSITTKILIYIYLFETFSILEQLLIEINERNFIHQQPISSLLKMKEHSTYKFINIIRTKFHFWVPLKTFLFYLVWNSMRTRMEAY